MDIGIPREKSPYEYRVALTPAAVSTLRHQGHRVYIEHNAGLGSGFSDGHYEEVGAIISYSSEEVYLRSELLLKVTRPMPEEFNYMQERQIVAAFWHLASANRKKMKMLLEKRVTAIGWETVEETDDYLPVLHVMGNLAGKLAPFLAERFLQNDLGGKGILLGGIAGVPPAEVVIIGAGSVGSAAAEAFLDVGATVYLLDKKLSALQRACQQLNRRVTTMLASEHNLLKVTAFADVLLSAVLIPGQRAPIVVTRRMVQRMRPRSVILDYSIDQGGSVETIRPTNHRDPIFVEEGVIHYGVPNITGIIGRTATHALSNTTVGYILAIANNGLEKAMVEVPAIRRGVNVMDGQILHPALQEIYKEGI